MRGKDFRRRIIETASSYLRHIRNRREFVYLVDRGQNTFRIGSPIARTNILRVRTRQDCNRHRENTCRDPYAVTYFADVLRRTAEPNAACSVRISDRRGYIEGPCCARRRSESTNPAARHPVRPPHAAPLRFSRNRITSSNTPRVPRDRTNNFESPRALGRNRSKGPCPCFAAHIFHTMRPSVFPRIAWDRRDLFHARRPKQSRIDGHRRTECTEHLPAKGIPASARHKEPGDKRLGTLDIQPFGASIRRPFRGTSGTMRRSARGREGQTRGGRSAWA